MKMISPCHIFGDVIVWNLLYISVATTILFSLWYIITGDSLALRGTQVSIFWTLYLNTIYAIKKHIIPLINKYEN
jgi:hypothetical protein